VLVELSVVEQRYHAVMEVLTAGASKTEVAARYGVSRQSVHGWVRRYQVDGLAGRPTARIGHTIIRRRFRRRLKPWCELRVHPRWGQRRLRHELGAPSTPRAYDPID
jgi:transposase